MHSVQKFFTGLLLMLFLMPSFAGAATFGVTDTGSASYPGMVSYNSGATQNDQVLNFALDADDNIYTIGTQATNISDWLMQKYDANGELDADWGTAGSIAYVGTGFDLGNDIAVDGNGNIYAAGGIQSNGFDVAVRKYDVDGALDTAWGSSGMVTHDSEPWQ
jgi:hypothetical protein